MHSLRRIHILLGVQFLILVLLSVNRLTSLTLGYVAQNEFMRWVDLNNMLVLPLVSVVAFYLLKRELEHGSMRRDETLSVILGAVFVSGVYILGAGYGNHEITNYLHSRFCPAGEAATEPLCSIITFNDDEFSHWVFFAGFVLVNAALLLLQTINLRTERMSRSDFALLSANGLLVGLAIFANLAFEQIGADLYIVALLALLAAVLMKRYGSQPLIVYYVVGYVLGFAGTILYKIAT